MKDHNNEELSRRQFLKRAASSSAGVALVGIAGPASATITSGSGNGAQYLLNYHKKTQTIVVGGYLTGEAAAEDAANAAEEYENGDPELVWFSLSAQNEVQKHNWFINPVWKGTYSEPWISSIVISADPNQPGKFRFSFTVECIRNGYD